MIWETVTIGIIVAAAVLYLVKFYRKSTSVDESPCGTCTTCSTCPVERDCDLVQIPDSIASPADTEK